MRCTVQLTIHDTAIFDVLAPELGKLDKTRSSVAAERRQDSTILMISTDDATALRATMDSIAQLLKVYEKMGSL